MSEKGFFTIATGNEHYYRIARNLLRSYRHFAKEPLPFAILADRENEYTEEFDEVILLENPTGSYLDKLSLYDHLPFDTGIFIDADCLAYADMNDLFAYFEQADDFSCFGRVLPLEDKTGWFNYEDLGNLQSRVCYCVGLHGGIYFIRKGNVSKAVFAQAKEIAQDYHRYQFKGKFTTPGDEPILALSMALHGCKPIAFERSAICCYWEHENAIKLDMKQGIAKAADGGQTRLVHWGTRFTRGDLYQKQVAALELLRQGKDPAWSNIKYEIKILWSKAVGLVRRAINKLSRMLRGA